MPVFFRFKWAFIIYKNLNIETNNKKKEPYESVYRSECVNINYTQQLYLSYENIYKILKYINCLHIYEFSFSYY